MARTTWILAGLAIARGAAAEPSPDGQPATTTLHATVELGVGTTFVARGVPQYTDRSNLATLDSLLFTVKDFGPGWLTFGCFHEAALTNTAMQSVTNGISPQFDPIAYYGMKLGRVEATAGYFLHLWPAWAEHPDGMHEIQVTAAVTGLPVRPAIEVDAEFVRMYGAYANASVSKTFTFGNLEVTPGAIVGVNGYDKPFAGTFDIPFSVREVTANIGVTWKIVHPFYMAFRAAYSYTGIHNWWMDQGVAGRSTPFAMIALGASD